MTPDWKAFELAVAAFCAALAPDAVVTHDAMIPDLDTGEPRQRDVWIEARVGGHFAVKILVSCKRLARKVNAQHLDAFLGELASSGAQKGVIYSLVGFTKGALAKAEKRGVSCCVLLADKPPPIPAVLTFDAYVLDESPRLVATGVDGPADWQELLNADGEVEGLTMPVYRALARLFAADGPALHEAIGAMLTPVRQVAVTLGEGGGANPIRLSVHSEWAIYRARTEAWLVNGSYSFTDQDFKGSISTPSIDTWGPEPGPGWDRIEEDEVQVNNTFRFYRMQGDIEPRLAAIAGFEEQDPKIGQSDTKSGLD